MTISATTQGIKPGVCTSTNRPASPFDGMVIYETDTDKVAVYDSSAWVYKTGTTAPISPGLILINAGTYSLVTSVSLPTNTFTSTYRNYKVIFDVNSTISSSALKLRFRAAGTDNTTSNYTQASAGFNSDNANVTLAESSTTSLTVATNYSVQPFIINLDIFKPQLSERTFGTGFYASDSSSGANMQTRPTAIKHETTTSFDSMTLFSSVASSMTGIFRVYGYSDS